MPPSELPPRLPNTHQISSCLLHCFYPQGSRKPLKDAAFLFGHLKSGEVK